jgi:hypothetical protein
MILDEASLHLCYGDAQALGFLPVSLPRLRGRVGWGPKEAL